MGRDNHSLWCTFARCCTVDSAHKSMNTLHMGLLLHICKCTYMSVHVTCAIHDPADSGSISTALIPAMYIFVHTLTAHCTVSHGRRAVCLLCSSFSQRRPRDRSLLWAGSVPRQERRWHAASGRLRWRGLLSRREFVILRFWNYKKLFESPQIYFYGMCPTLMVIEK